MGDSHSAEMRVFAKDARSHIGKSPTLPGQFNRQTANTARMSSPIHTADVKVMRNPVVQLWGEAGESDSIWSSPPTRAASVAATSGELDTLACGGDAHFSMMRVTTEEPRRNPPGS
jgi:hypothetical protein